MPAKGLNNLVLNKVNKFRTDSGLKALKVGSDMSSYTNIRANELRTKFSHTRPNGQICYDFFINKHPIKSGGTIGENIAMHCSTQRESYEAIAEIIVEGWKNSPGHRKIMLLPNVDYISIGVAKDTKELVPGYSGNCSYFVLWVGRY